ncbi:HEAT repeat domain-containing protein [Collinsella sp. An2]|uniref:HEAT repeat domain-containing protein n=1 Tax=Collinsella sp. An2 TaxID=1965585 RepID=UPI000B389F3D|nr:HEAT repeat domain-containing protein [Collinsella sp. An2]OUP08241.1 hypothetical protein B5F33_07455 [Collinsella sp. An2]
MTASIFIAFYAIVSLAMIIFDLVFLQWETVRAFLLERRSRHMATLLETAIARGLDGTDAEHRQLLSRRLRTLSGMESFDRTMERLSSEMPDEAEHYLEDISGVFDTLLPSFTGRDSLRRAYFAAIVTRWYRGRPASSALIADLFACLSDKALYSRQNAFEALVHISTATEIARAVRLLDADGAKRAHRLISETLLAYPGDRNELADALLEGFKQRTPEMQVCIINFLRHARTARYGCEPAPIDRHQFLLDLMQDDRANLEVRLACMRYFMTNPWESALDPIVDFTRADTSASWEYAAVAATVLGSYPCDKTVQALKRCLHSPVYHVRYNAAESLFRLGATPERELANIMCGDDRFARDMVVFRWKLGGASDANDKTEVPVLGGDAA